jgi:transcriptional regulator with XRE-family HTH domain
MGVNSKFGRHVRALRADRAVGLRQFARDVGISPTYLSKIERGEFPPPAEDKVVAIADALGQDRDELLALAGRVAADLESVILRHPKELAAFLRSIHALTAEEIRCMTHLVEQVRNAPPEARRRWVADGCADGPPVPAGRRDGAPEDTPGMSG